MLKRPLKQRRFDNESNDKIISDGKTLPHRTNIVEKKLWTYCREAGGYFAQATL